MALVAVILGTHQTSTLADSSLAFEHFHTAPFTVNHVSASLAKRPTTGIARFHDSTIHAAVMTTHTAVRTMMHGPATGMTFWVSTRSARNLVIRIKVVAVGTALLVDGQHATVQASRGVSIAVSVV